MRGEKPTVFRQDVEIHKIKNEVPFLVLAFFPTTLSQTHIHPQIALHLHNPTHEHWSHGYAPKKAMTYVV